jgi:hypothetical protein
MGTKKEGGRDCGTPAFCLVVPMKRVTDGGETADSFGEIKVGSRGREKIEGFVWMLPKIEDQRHHLCCCLCVWSL